MVNAGIMTTWPLSCLYKTTVIYGHEKKQKKKTTIALHAIIIAMFSNNFLKYAWKIIMTIRLLICKALFFCKCEMPLHCLVLSRYNGHIFRPAVKSNINFGSFWDAIMTPLLVIISKNDNPDACHSLAKLQLDMPTNCFYQQFYWQPSQL